MNDRVHSWIKKFRIKDSVRVNPRSEEVTGRRRVVHHRVTDTSLVRTRSVKCQHPLVRKRPPPTPVTVVPEQPQLQPQSLRKDHRCPTGTMSKGLSCYTRNLGTTLPTRKGRDVGSDRVSGRVRLVSSGVGGQHQGEEPQISRFTVLTKRVYTVLPSRRRVSEVRV